MNYFELYDLPVTFTPDPGQLKQKFFELSRRYHPDFFTQENEYEQAEALEKAASVNKAYKVLLNRDETIKYVLQLKALLEEEEKYRLEPDFLMEMMELNEQLADAKMEGDTASSEKVKQEIKRKEEEIYQPVKSIVEDYDDATATTADLLKVKEYYFQKKYLNRILATIG